MQSHFIDFRSLIVSYFQVFSNYKIHITYIEIIQNLDIPLTLRTKSRSPFPDPEYEEKRIAA